MASLLYSQTLGNSLALLLDHGLDEMHIESWLRRLLLYLTECDVTRTQKKAFEDLSSIWTAVSTPPPYKGSQTYTWLLAYYSQDVLVRLEKVKAQITSVYGRIPKIDSMKITKLSVMTMSKDTGLPSMTEGIVRRYGEAGIHNHFSMYYVDRNYCSKTGQPSSKLIFEAWDLTTFTI